MDISNINLPEELKQNLIDLSGNKEKQLEYIRDYRKQQIIDMVCRQTELSREDAEYFLTKTNGDIITAIRLYMSGETRETLNRKSVMEAVKQKSNRTVQQAKTVNQQIYQELRHFMDKCAYQN